MHFTQKVPVIARFSLENRGNPVYTSHFETFRAKQSSACTFSFSGLLRRFAPRNDGGIAIVCIVETELKLSDAFIFPDENILFKITNFRLKLR